MKNLIRLTKNTLLTFFYESTYVSKTTSWNDRYIREIPQRVGDPLWCRSCRWQLFGEFSESRPARRRFQAQFGARPRSTGHLFGLVVVAE